MLRAGPACQRLRRELHSPLRGSPMAQGLWPYGRGKWLCPLPLPAVGGPPPQPQRVCAAARPPCLLQTHTIVFGPLGCASAHLGTQGGRATAHTRPAGRARAPRPGPGAPLSPDGRAVAPRKAGAPNAPGGAFLALQISHTRNGFSSVGQRHVVQQVQRCRVSKWLAIKKPSNACPDPSIAIEYDQTKARKRRIDMGEFVRQRLAFDCCASDLVQQQVFRFVRSAMLLVA